MVKKYAMDWQVGWSEAAEEPPERMVLAAVPGAVQLDWAKAEVWGDPYYGENWREYEWMEDKYWTYRTMLQAPVLSPGERLYFVSKGIDYSFRVCLDGVELLRQEGMFTPVELDLTDLCRQGSILEIVLDPAPKRADAARSRSEADHSCKPAVSYGWDWHPRLIPLGIWDDTFLRVQSRRNLQSCEVFCELNEQLDQAKLLLAADFTDGASGQLEWIVLDPEGTPVIQTICEISDKSRTLVCTVDKPQLWWPHDQGAQPLYQSEVHYRPSGSSSASEIYRQRIGIRRVRLVMHEGAWKEPSRFPKSRSNPPISMEVNGREVFCKGTNWVQPDVFPGRITADNYRVLLGMAKAANMNMLRVWGGGIVNKESFYEQCDEMGLMVWQEFPLACNLYPDSAAYLRVLDQESRSILVRLRKHPSVVLWCGGNELFNAWSRMTEQSLPLRLLNKNCYELNPGTPFMMTSPLEGMGHGHYMFRYETGEDVLQAMIRADNTAYTEFGVPAPAPVELLKKFLPPEEWFPPKPGTSWESHHAFGALAENMWLMADQLEYYFGSSETLEQLVENGQLLQSEGYKCIYEESRRQKPKCSMALNWCYNEPWPAAANNSIICWPDVPKPAYFAIQASCRPTLASARIPKFDWKEGEWFEAELWLLNDSPQVAGMGRMEVYLTVGFERHHLLLWDFAETAANENRRGPTVRFRLPGGTPKRLLLELIVVDRQEWSSEYTVLLRGSVNPDLPVRQMLNLETAE